VAWSASERGPGLLAREGLVAVETTVSVGQVGFACASRERKYFRVYIEGVQANGVDPC